MQRRQRQRSGNDSETAAATAAAKRQYCSSSNPSERSITIANSSSDANQSVDADCGSETAAPPATISRRCLHASFFQKLYVPKSRRLQRNHVDYEENYEITIKEFFTTRELHGMFYKCEKVTTQSAETVAAKSNWIRKTAASFCLN